jgi:hypothetical protein
MPDLPHFEPSTPGALLLVSLRGLGIDAGTIQAKWDWGCKGLPAGDTLAVLKKSAKKSGENLVNFFPAFYPAEYDYSIISDLTSYTVFSGAYAIVLFKPFHLVDIKIGKDIF